MKKTYIIPSVNVVSMATTSHILAGSFPVDPTKSGGTALVKENDWDIFGEYSDVEE